MKKTVLIIVLCVVIEQCCSQYSQYSQYRPYRRIKRGKYYSNFPQRIYSRPPYSIPAAGIYSATPPPNYKDEEPPYPGSRPKVSRPTNDGLGDDDINNLVNKLSKQELDKIVEYAKAKENHDSKDGHEFNNGFKPSFGSFGTNDEYRSSQNDFGENPNIPIDKYNENYQYTQDTEAPESIFNKHSNEYSNVLQQKENNKFDKNKFQQDSKPYDNLYNKYSYKHGKVFPQKDSTDFPYDQHDTDHYQEESKTLDGVFNKHADEVSKVLIKDNNDFTNVKYDNNNEYRESSKIIDNVFDKYSNENSKLYYQKNNKEFSNDKYNVNQYVRESKTIGNAFNKYSSDYSKSIHQKDSNDFNFDKYNEKRQYGQGYKTLDGVFNKYSNQYSKEVNQKGGNDFVPMFQNSDSQTSNYDSKPNYKSFVTEPPPLNLYKVTSSGYQEYKEPNTGANSVNNKYQNSQVYTESSTLIYEEHFGDEESSNKHTDNKDRENIYPPLSNSQNNAGNGFYSIPYPDNQEQEQSGNRPQYIENYNNQNGDVEENLPRPINYRDKNEFEVSYSNKVPFVANTESSTYKVESFGDLPLMDYNSKLASSDSYNVPHYTVTSGSSYSLRAPSSSTSSSSISSSSYGKSQSPPIEPAPPLSAVAAAAREQSEAHLKAIRIWSNRSKGTAYTLNDDGSLTLERPLRPKHNYGYS